MSQKNENGDIITKFDKNFNFDNKKKNFFLLPQKILTVDGV